MQCRWNVMSMVGKRGSKHISRMTTSVAVPYSGYLAMFMSPYGGRVGFMEIIGEEGWDWIQFPGSSLFYAFSNNSIPSVADSARHRPGFPKSWLLGSYHYPVKNQDVIQLLGACCSIFLVRYCNKDSRLFDNQQLHCCCRYYCLLFGMSQTSQGWRGA